MPDVSLGTRAEFTRGTPSVFTGLHGDYHQRTDQAEYIDNPHYARITRYIGKLGVTVANGPRRRMNGSRPARPPRPVVPYLLPGRRT